MPHSLHVLLLRIVSDAGLGVATKLLHALGVCACVFEACDVFVCILLTLGEYFRSLDRWSGISEAIPCFPQDDVVLMFMFRSMVVHMTPCAKCCLIGILLFFVLLQMSMFAVCYGNENPPWSTSCCAHFCLALSVHLGWFC